VTRGRNARRHVFFFCRSTHAAENLQRRPKLINGRQIAAKASQFLAEGSYSRWSWRQRAEGGPWQRRRALAAGEGLWRREPQARFEQMRGQEEDHGAIPRGEGSVRAADPIQSRSSRRTKPDGSAGGRDGPHEAAWGGDSGLDWTGNGRRTEQ
jgi:hypothetical protein